MKRGTAISEDVSVHVPAGSWPEIAAGTTDGSGLTIDDGPHRATTPWPEAAGFTTEGWYAIYTEDLRR